MCLNGRREEMGTKRKSKWGAGEDVGNRVGVGLEKRLEVP